MNFSHSSEIGDPSSGSIRSTTRWYKNSEINQILRYGLDSETPLKAASRPGCIVDLSDYQKGDIPPPRNRIVFSHAITRNGMEGRVVREGHEVTADFVSLAKDSDPSMMLLPIMLDDNHWVGLVIVRREDGKYNVLSFDSMGSKAHAHSFLLHENAVKNVLGQENVKLQRWEANVQQGDVWSCGPYVVDFLSRAAANLRLACRSGFDLNGPDIGKPSKERSFHATVFERSEEVAGLLIKRAAQPGGRGITFGTDRPPAPQHVEQPVSISNQTVQSGKRSIVFGTQKQPVQAIRPEEKKPRIVFGKVQPSPRKIFKINPAP